MSKQIDERVVSMQFDNKNFESNVQTSLSTIDKLKQKLNFKGAAKGLESVNSAAKKVDMSGVGAAVGTISSRFSAMEVIGVTALANITNQAVNAGKRIAAALTIDPVKTGFKEYETQINAVQTILANTQSKGTVIDDVNKALEELNKYADMTIYNFTEMTRNIGTFTAAGVDLDTSVNAIKGIANLAAVSGSTSQQASTAMYQLSQALSSGTVKLMDWNSVVNAGMGGQVFQDALKETARVSGVAIDSLIEKHGSFRETLSEGWLTSQILTDTLQKFTLTTEGLTEAQIEENRQMLKAKGYTDDQIKAIFELGATATNAATKVKTFTQLWDVLKEAAQSGWSQTWKLLIGDFEEAKALLTPLADFLTSVINKTSDWRNKLLEGALSFNPWQALMKKLESSGLASVKKYADSISDVAKTVEYYQNVMTDVWKGNYKNSDTGRYGLLDQAGHDHRVIQDLVNLSDKYYKGQGYKYQLTIEDIQASQKKFGVAVTESTETVQDMSVVLENLTDEQLKNAGLTAEEIKLFRELAAESKRTGVPLQELIDQMSKVDGRTLLIDSFKNAGQGLVSVITAIKDAWSEVFPPITSAHLYNIIKGLNDFSQHLIVSDDTADKLKRTLKGVFAIVHILTTILGGGFKIAFKIISQILGLFNLDILDVTASIGDALVAFDKWIDSALDFTGIFKKIMPYLKTFGKGLKNTFGKVKNYFQPAIDAVKNWFASLKTSDNLAYDIITGLAKGIVAGTKFIAKAIAELGKHGWKGLKSLFGKGESEGIGHDIISGLVLGIRDGAKIIWDAMTDLGKTLLEKIKDVLGIHSPSTAFIAIGGFIISGLLIGLKNGFPTVWNTLKDFGSKCVSVLSGIDFGALIALGTIIGALFVGNKIANALENFSAPFAEFGESMERVSKGAKNWLNAKAFKELAISLAILVGAIVVLTLVDTKKMWHAVGAIAVMGVILGGLMGLMGWISKSNVDIKDTLNFGKISLVMLAMSGSIAIIAAAMKTLSDIKIGGLIKAGIAIAVIGGIIAGLIYVTQFAGKDTTDVGLTILGVSAAMLIMVKAIEILSKIDHGNVASGILAIQAFARIIMLLILTSALIDKAGGGGNIGGSILKISIAILAMVYIAKICGSMDPSTLKKGILGITAFSAIIVALMAATRLAGGGKKIDKLGGSIFKISLAIGAIVLVSMLCAAMSTEDLIKGAAGVAAFGGIIVGLMAATRLLKKGAGDIGKSILNIAIAIGILALVATLLGFVDTEHLLKGIVAVALLAGVVSGIIIASKDAEKAKTSLIALAAAIGIMTIAIIALSFIEPTRLASSVLALSGVMAVFALLLKAAGSMKTDGKALNNMGTILALAAVVAAFGFVIYKLASLPDPMSVIAVTVALSIFITAMAGVMFILSKLKTGTIGSAIKGALALTAMVVPLLAFAWAIAKGVPPMPGHVADSLKVLIPVVTIMALLCIPLTVAGLMASGAIPGILMLTALAGTLFVFALAIANMPDVSGATKSLAVLLPVVAVMTLLLVPLSIVGLLGVFGLAGIVLLTAMAGLLYTFALTIDNIPDISHAEKTLSLLMPVIVTLTLVLVPLSLIGLLAPAALLGIVAMVALVVAIGGLAAIISALDIGDLITDGLPILVAVSEALGWAIGKFIAAFAHSMMNTLPLLGTSLSMFMVNAMPFILGAKQVDSKVLAGAGYLAGAVIALSVADFINGVTTFLGGPFSFVSLGTQLSQFIVAAWPFITAVSSIDPAIMTGVKSLADAILILTAANVIDGIMSFLGGGEASLGSFGSELATLGTGLKDFADSIKDFDDATLNKIKLAGDAIKALAEASDAIPETGGLWQKIFGENSLAGFADGIKKVGGALKAFVGEECLGNFGKEQYAVVENGCKAITAFAEAADEIPNNGGLFDRIFGTNGLAAFGEEIKSVGGALAAFVGSDGIGNFGDKDVSVVSSACSAIKEFKDAATYVGEGSFWSKLFSDDLTEFSKHFGPLGAGLRSFSDNLKGVQLVNMSYGVSAIKDIASAVATLPEDYGDKITNAGPKIGEFATHFKGFFDAMSGINTYKISQAQYAMKVLQEDILNKLDVSKAMGFGIGIQSIITPLKEMNAISPTTTAGFVAAIENLADLTIGDINEALDVRNFDVKAVGENIATTLQSGIDEASPVLGDSAAEAIKTFATGVEENQGVAETAFQNVVTACTEIADSCQSEFTTAGSNVVSGFANGILSSSAAINAARSMILSAIAAAKEAAQINSPSKVAMRLGYGIPEGLALGIDKLGYLVSNSAVAVTDDAINGMKDTISGISNFINSDVDTQPTIRPVFDLSEIRAGTQDLDNMLSGRTLSVNSSAIGSLSESMAARQNGNNSHELLSAIRGLRKDMTDNPRNTYSINGINVTEGSDVADAIKTIVNAVIVEGRK